MHACLIIDVNDHLISKSLLNISTDEILPAFYIPNQNTKHSNDMTRPPNRRMPLIGKIRFTKHYIIYNKILFMPCTDFVYYNKTITIIIFVSHFRFPNEVYNKI